MFCELNVFNFFISVQNLYCGIKCLTPGRLKAHLKANLPSLLELLCLGFCTLSYQFDDSNDISSNLEVPVPSAYLWHICWTLSSKSMSLLHYRTRTEHSTPYLAICLPSSMNTLLTHVQLGVYQDSQVLFCRATFYLGAPSMSSCLGLFLLWCTFSCWTAWGSCHPISQACWGSYGWMAA